MFSASQMRIKLIARIMAEGVRDIFSLLHATIRKHGQQLQTVRLGKDPRLLAWSHIYLGRMDDLEHSRDEAVAQYQQALVVRDGRVDTREAAEHGLKEPYGPPPGARHAEDEDDGTPEKTAPEKDDASPNAASPDAAKPKAGSPDKAAPDEAAPSSPAGAATVSPAPAPTTPPPQR